MPLRCGVDIVHIKKIELLMNKPETLKKLFNADELRGDAEHLAGMFAAKEAFFKALGMHPRFLEIAITYEKSGRPKLEPASDLRKFESCDLSISHDGEYALAMVVLQ